ncbi:MAG: ABC transporter permease [Mesorhizobium sp.]|nr:ABC transporter permease [Mesorhizobium sp. M1D.F.Ca.ET.043.01.1.1]RWA82341.1 MAG: ABC transporter permease [Mesorhizobium sp.]RWE09804.1 MAG: ABC transporter permease [Mesorhizobium sp.]TJW88428.1 MAG: ABC transporter permease [Mesorhizobium sp.]
MTVMTFSDAFADIGEAVRKRHLATTFGWQDVAQRYRRSRIGAFWLTINMGVMIGALGLIFGNLFRAPMQEFLPFVGCGLIVWSFISTCLSDGCASFISAEGIILQVRMPLFTHVMRSLWRNIIVFAHNLVIVPIALIAVSAPISWAALIALPGFVVVSINLLWMMLVLATICARFRDMTQVVQNFLQVIFYATPIVWQMKTLPANFPAYFFDLNPFYHLITLIRAPLLGEIPSSVTWLYAITTSILGWLFALWFFGRYRKRIPYWL